MKQKLTNYEKSRGSTKNDGKTYFIRESLENMKPIYLTK